MKQVFISGNITKDAVKRKTQGGDTVTGFSVAVNDARTKDTMFFDCSIWGVRADRLQPHLVKGKQVSVVGELGKREHEGRTYLTVNVSELTLMGGGNRDGEKPASQRQDDSFGNKPRGNFSRDLDDDIPF